MDHSCLYYMDKNNQIFIRIHVQPKANTNLIVGIAQSFLKIKLKTPPIKGQANAELIKLLSSVLQIGAHKISLKGEKSRYKTAIFSHLELRESQKILEFLETLQTQSHL